MISKPVFGTSNLVKCLINLGFAQIVLQNKSTYDRITCKNIVKEIKMLGFTKAEIDEAMK